MKRHLDGLEATHLETGSQATFSDLDKAAEAVLIWTKGERKAQPVSVVKSALRKALNRPVHNHCYGFAWKLIHLETHKTP